MTARQSCFCRNNLVRLTFTSTFAAS